MSSVPGKPKPETMAELRELLPRTMADELIAHATQEYERGEPTRSRAQRTPAKPNMRRLASASGTYLDRSQLDRSQSDE